MFFIRADGNAEIGAGHLMRCLSIAKELQAAGQNVCFVCADEQSAALAEKYGFQTHVLGTDHRNMESELPSWRLLIDNLKKTDCFDKHAILVDSYHVTNPYLTALGQFGYIGLLEDFGTCEYPVDCVINYNAQASLLEYEKLYQGKEVFLLIGSDYVPLRRQFRVSPDYCYHIRNEVREVLITTGGGDSTNIAGKILEEIYDSERIFHLVAGHFNPHFYDLKTLEECHANIRIHHDVTDMAELMRRCDIGLTAGGSTVYELAALGVPFLCFSYADNQEALVQYIGRKEIAGAAGAWNHDAQKTVKEIGKLFAELCCNREKRALCSKRERGMVDGYGAVRIAAQLVRELVRYT